MVVHIASLPQGLSRERICRPMQGAQETGDRRRGFDPWVEKIPWNRKWQPTLVFLPEKSHGQRSLAGYSPWGHKRVRHNLAKQQYLVQISLVFYLMSILGVCFRIQWIIKKARQFQKNIYFSFIDYAKAFDCVDHHKLLKILEKEKKKKLLKILQEMGIPDHLTCFLRNLYAGQEATVRTGHGTTD